MSRNGSIWHNVDWITVVLWMVMMLFGWLNIYGASYNFEQSSIFNFDNNSGKQFVWIVSSVLVATILLLIDSKTYDMLAYVVYGCWIIILLITPILATDVKGSLSWIDIGHGIRFQPAEFAKCFTALALAKYMSRYGYELRTWKDMIVPALIIAVPMLIIMVLQKETGSALVFVAFLLVLYREGMSGYILLLVLAAATFFIIVIKYNSVMLPLGLGNVGILVSMLLICCILLYFLLKNSKRIEALILTGTIVVGYVAGIIINIWHTIDFNILAVIITIVGIVETAVFAYLSRNNQLWILVAISALFIGYCESCTMVFEKVLAPHQQSRIEVLLGVKEDPAGVGYNVRQARIAIGSGGLFGKGYLQGTQTKLKYVPEQHTDFIFCTVGEEWGFIGTLFVLGIYLAFILRLIYLAERQKNMFSQIFGYSVASILFAHLAINVGMVIGVLPVIGIPLPFFSYGGSSLWGFTLLLFIFLKRDAARVEQWR